MLPPRISSAVLLAAWGCSEPPRDAGLGAAPVERAPVHRGATAEPAPSEVPSCPGALLHVEGGAERGWICPDEVDAAGDLTVVDLSDAWTPAVFAAGPDGEVPRYRARYVALATEIAPDDEGDAEKSFVELYGVVPAPSAILRRLGDDTRSTCHDAIDNAPLLAWTGVLTQGETAVVRRGDLELRWLAASLDGERRRRRLADVAALAKVPALRRRVATLRRLEARRAALITAQRHLVCEHLLEPREVDGVFTWRSGQALDMFQRLHFLIPHGRLDGETRAALIAGSRELEYRAALRMLRERVVDALGLIEDGSAGLGPVPVVDRVLDPVAMRLARGHRPLPGAAVDLVGTTTDIAARQLGWTDPHAVRRFLERHAGRPLHVALRLPPPPPYHSPHMELSAEIDRGDVWYDARPTYHRAERRPALVLYVTDGGVRRPLVRWPTTIGGWADQRLASGWVVRRWKESDVGRRVWRQLYAAPTWYPPKTTPDRDLVRNLWNGRWRLKSEVLGPGPRSAYGMLMLVHDKPVGSGRALRYSDNGIRTHGSSTVTSIAEGTSHGCHRLFNQLAVRLGSFLLRHRHHVRRGHEPEPYLRLVRYRGLFTARLENRGYLFELDPPVPIDVLPGRVRSPRKVPPRGWAPASAE